MKLLQRIYIWFYSRITNHKIGYHGAIGLVTKKGRICAECGRKIK